MKVLALLWGLILFCMPAQAAMLEFSGVPDIGPMATTYVEDGVTVQSIGGDLAYHVTPGRVHITDSGTSFAAGVSFTTGNRFDAVSFDIDGTNDLFCFANGCGGVVEFNNVRVIGERGGVQVADRSFYSETEMRTEVLGLFFLDIDKLIISILSPASVMDTTCEFTAPCTFFDIDNVVLIPTGVISAVPLPAGLPLYGAGLLLLGYFARKKKNKAS